MVIKSKLISKKEIVDDVWEISFDIKDKHLLFKAGQYIRLVLSALDSPDTKGPARLFSIASSPNDKEKISIIFRISDSGFKKTLVKMPIGATVQIEGPWGTFVLPKDYKKQLVFIAGGTGIAPFLSMIRFATEEKLPHHIVLFYSSRDKNNIVYHQELKTLASQNSKLTIHYVHYPVDEKFTNALFYLSGPPGMIDQLKDTIQKQQGNEKNIYYEEWNCTEFLKPQICGMFKLHTDSIFLTDLAGIIKYVNPAWEKTSGWTALEVVNKCTPRVQKSGRQNAEFYRKFWNENLSGKVFRRDMINRRKDKSLYETDHLYIPIFSEAKQIIGFAAFQRILSEVKAKEYKKNKAMLIQEESFLSIASHELRTPLTAIDGLISMILDEEYGIINQEIKQPLKDIMDSSEKLIHLVNSLLNLSRIQSGYIKYIYTKFSLLEKLKKIITLLEAVARKKNIKFDLKKIDDVFITADEDKFTQIVDNLVGNAIKFTDNGGVTISTKKHRDHIEVIFSDSGIGIAKKDVPKLFGKFQQVGQDEHKHSGTGLGLYISREIARKMGGDLWLEKSRPGVGSTFILSIPCVIG